jgi:hypothetical protein
VEASLQRWTFTRLVRVSTTYVLSHHSRHVISACSRYDGCWHSTVTCSCLCRKVQLSIRCDRTHPVLLLCRDSLVARWARAFSSQVAATQHANRPLTPSLNTARLLAMPTPLHSSSSVLVEPCSQRSQLARRSSLPVVRRQVSRWMCCRPAMLDSPLTKPVAIASRVLQARHQASLEACVSQVRVQIECFVSAF